MLNNTFCLFILIMTVKELRDKLSVYKDNLEVVYNSPKLMGFKVGKINSIDIGIRGFSDEKVIMLSDYDS